MFGVFQYIAERARRKKRQCELILRIGFVLRAAIDFGGSIFVQKIFS